MLKSQDHKFFEFKDNLAVGHLNTTKKNFFLAESYNPLPQEVSQGKKRRVEYNCAEKRQKILFVSTAEKLQLLNFGLGKEIN